METQNSSVDQVKRNKPKSFGINPIHFFIAFIAISSIAAFLIGGYFIGKDKANNLEGQVKINPSQIPANPDNWSTHNLTSAGIEFKLPETLLKKGDWREKIEPGEKGSIVVLDCFQSNSDKKCNKSDFVAGAMSSDYSAPKGTGSFLNSQGFIKENGVYYVIFTDNKKIELRNIKTREINNENGLKILKILGANYNKGTATGHPIVGTPGEGYLGAIIITKNPKYPALVIQLKIDSDISELEFDQILNSIKSTN